MRQFTFNPYKAIEYREPDAAVFDVGRRLQRLRFHLHQAWLLGDADGFVPSYPRVRSSRTASQLRWIACHRQFQRADKVCAHLSTAIYSIDVEDPGWLSEKIRSQSCNLIDEAFPERCYEVFDDLRAYYRPDKLEQLFEECIDQNVGPGFQRLRRAILFSLAENNRRILQAGMVLEEGLCRSDVYCFLPSPVAEIDDLYCHLNLDSDEIERLEALEGKPLESWDSYEVGASNDPNDFSLKRRLDHQAGQLRPDANWPLRLLAAWKHASLATHCLSQVCDSSFLRQPLGEISAAIEELYERACRQLSSRVGCDRLQVDVENLTLTLDGKQHSICPQAAYLFAELLKAPSWQKPFTQIRQKHPDVFGANDRLDQIIKSLPRDTAGILKSSKGKPCQIELPRQ